MSNPDVIRAWKDEDYRLSLGEAQRRALPDNPAGLVELSDSDLGSVVGGVATGGANPICQILSTWCSANCSSWSCGHC